MMYATALNEVTDAKLRQKMDTSSFVTFLEFLSVGDSQ